MNDLKKFHAALKLARGQPQKEVCQAVGISQATLTRWLGEDAFNSQVSEASENLKEFLKTADTQQYISELKEYQEQQAHLATLGFEVSIKMCDLVLKFLKKGDEIIDNGQISDTEVCRLLPRKVSALAQISMLSQESKAKLLAVNELLENLEKGEKASA